MPETDLVPTVEAAAILRVSRATINRWADKGRLPIALRGPGSRGSQFFRRADVDQLRNEMIREFLGDQAATAS